NHSPRGGVAANGTSRAANLPGIGAFVAFDFGLPAKLSGNRSDLDLDLSLDMLRRRLADQAGSWQTRRNVPNATEHLPHLFARMIPTYPVQRQRLPLIATRISCSSAFRLRTTRS